MGWIRSRSLWWGFGAIVLVVALLQFFHQTPALHLTMQEQQWLDMHPVIRIAPVPNYPPVEFFDDSGTYAGYAADIMKHIERELGITFTVVREDSRDRTLEAVQKNRADVLMAISSSDARMQYLLFTESILMTQDVIVARIDDPRNLELDSLEGKKVAVIAETATAEYLLAKGRNIHPVYVESGLEGLTEVSLGRADATILTYISAYYFIQKLGFTNLRIAGEYPEARKLRLAVRKDWPIFHSILEKALAAIHEDELRGLQSKWVTRAFEPHWWNRIPWLWVEAAIILIGLLFTGTVVWNRSLAQRVKKRTAEVQQELAERIRVEQALRRSEDRVRALLDANPDMMFLMTRDGVFLDYKSAHADTLYRPPEEFIGRNIRDLMPPDIAAATMEAIEETIRTENAVSYEYRLPVGEQMKFWEARLVPCGEHVLGIVRDITDRKDWEQALIRLTQAVETSGEVIFMTDPEGVFTYVNPEFTRVYGYAADEVVGKQTPRVIKSGESDESHYTEFWNSLLAKQIVKGELRNRTKQGKILDIEGSASPIVDHEGRVAGFLAVQRDITDRKQTEKALKESEEKFRRIFDLSPVGVIMLGLDGTFARCNAAFCSFLGQTEQELIGKTFLDITPRDKEADSRWNLGALVDGTIDRVQVQKRFLHKDGRAVWGEVSVRLVRDEKGEPSYFLPVVLDITNQKQLALQLAESNKMESLGTLAGGVAHDFNNILNIILGCGDLLGRTASPAERKYVDMILNASERAAGLVKQILTFARRTSQEAATIVVNPLVEELVKMLYETFPRTIEISTDLDRNLPPILGDKTHIHQALLNLAVNARDAMPSGGDLTFRTQTIESAEIENKFPGIIPGKYVCISVQDTGSGMEAETVRRIFEPFFTTKEQGKGTGLGLAVVYGIVTGMRGYVDARSRINEGTTFTLYFPAEAGHAASPQTSVQKQLTARGSETILLVEDEETLREILTETLESHGYRVYQASNGDEALKLYSSRKDEIHLILSDFGLPKINGHQCYLEMKKITPDVKFVLASGFVDPHERTRMKANGISAFLQKPYRPHEILTVLRSVLDRPPIRH